MCMKVLSNPKKYIKNTKSENQLNDTVVQW